MKTYLDKPFIIDNTDARIRKANDLLSFEKENGDFKRIPNGTSIRVTDVKLLNDKAYVLADGWGWTNGANLKDQFVNEALGEFPPNGSSKKGPNAAWDKGVFLKQLTLIQVVGVDNRLKFISKDIAPHYLKMVFQAAADGIPLPLRWGFRSYPEQELLYKRWKNKVPGAALAAEPGTSNHQDGYAYDFANMSYEGDRKYDWMKANGPRHGFVRTVNKEPWHWEYRPDIAATGVYKTSNVEK